MSSSNQLDAATAVLLIVAILIILPFLTMAIGFGGMMGYGGMMQSGGMMGQYGGTGGGWLLVGVFVPVVLLVVVLGGGYLLLKRGSDDQTGHDPAIEELRMAYARGELSDEEFDERRRQLRTETEE